MLGNELIIAVASWAGGIVATVIVQQILNRRRVLTYYVRHQYLGSSAQDRTFGDVEITWNGSAVPNLHLSTVTLTNESSRDLENVKVRTFTGDTILLSEFPQLVGTTEVLRYSPEYEAELKVPKGQSPSKHQLEKYQRQREYIIPVMNRGQVVQFQYLNTSKTPDPPAIWLESVHPGVSLKFRTPQPLVHGVRRSRAQAAGLIFGIVFAALAAAYSPYATLTAFACLFFGLVALLPGAYIIRGMRAFTRWITG